MSGETILYTEEQIASRVSELADAIERTHQDRSPLLVCILGGGLVLLADLIRRLTIPFDCAFLSINTPERGEFRVMFDIAESVRGRPVILVDGAIVSGSTHLFVMKWLMLRGAASVEICAIVGKTTLPPEIPTGLIGFRTDRFAVGYGIANKGRYRGSRDVIEINP